MNYVKISLQGRFCVVVACSEFFLIDINTGPADNGSGLEIRAISSGPSIGIRFVKIQPCVCLLNYLLL
jgi:hypothetical protein